MAFNTGTDIFRMVFNPTLETVSYTHLPKDAGICIEAAKTLGKEIPTLGVCLGHQAICEAYGATVSYAKELMHGKQSTITIDETCPIFQGMGNTMKAARYHSLAAVKETIPETLKVTAKTKDGEVMAVMHREYPIYGVQSVSYTHLFGLFVNWNRERRLCVWIK